MNRSRVTTLAVVGVLALLSYFIFLAGFSRLYSSPSKPISTTDTTLKDNLSGSTYSTGGINNYRESNPHGSYFVGFDELTQNGVSYNDSLYIQDVLTNVTMYTLKTYNAKISFVANSFRDKGSVDGEKMVYSFKFGVNDTNVHTVNVNSTTVASLTGEGILKVSISDSQNKQLFSKTFAVPVSN